VDRVRSVKLRLALGAAAALVAAAGCAPATVAPASAPTPLAFAGSGHGSLLIVGGGPIPDVLIARFVTLAGGRGHARILAMPMASEDADAGVEIVGDFRHLGADSERLVLTHAQADTEATAQKIAGATGIWFGGGDQSRLMAVLKGTRAEAAIRELYLRGGGVLGGTSAGAAVMSTPMITGDERHPGGDRPPAKDSSDAFMTIARDDVISVEGLDVVPGAIVDQHFVRRRRHNRLLSLVLENPRLVGIGIDESTALEAPPEGPWRILGASVAVVYDARAAKITPAGTTLGAAEVKLSVLPAGSTYDVATGTVTLP
jgi:cyanophycinase